MTLSRTVRGLLDSGSDAAEAIAAHGAPPLTYAGFRALVGRTLQKEAGQPEQIVICSPLLVGLDGAKKMSKSSDNYIAFNDAPKEMFCKIMSISDEVLWDYYELLLEVDDEALKNLKAGHPMAAKKNLAATLVGKFHGAEAGTHELAQFEKVFSKHEIPDEMPTFKFGALTSNADANVVELLAATKLIASKNEVKRLIEQVKNRHRTGRVAHGES